MFSPFHERRKVPKSRFFCDHQTFVDSCPDVRALIRLSCVHFQTFKRSCPDFLPIKSTFVRSCPDFRAFIFRIFCVRAFVFFVHLRFSMFPDYVVLDSRRPPRVIIFGLDILASVWDLNLGCYTKLVNIRFDVAC